MFHTVDACVTRQKCCSSRGAFTLAFARRSKTSFVMIFKDETTCFLLAWYLLARAKKKCQDLGTSTGAWSTRRTWCRFRQVFACVLGGSFSECLPWQPRSIERCIGHSSFFRPSRPGYRASLISMCLKSVQCTCHPHDTPMRDSDGFAPPHLGTSCAAVAASNQRVHRAWRGFSHFARFNSLYPPAELTEKAMAYQTFVAPVLSQTRIGNHDLHLPPRLRINTYDVAMRNAR